tara:strand:- start:49 stop:1119 length:1071 start_codon:yes stop_codon:yes gene_type:complete
MRVDLLGSYMRAQQIQQQAAARAADQQDRAEARQERADNRKMRLDTLANQKRVGEIIGRGDITEETANEVLKIDLETGLRMREHLSKLSIAKKEEVKALADQTTRMIGAIESLPPEARAAAFERTRQQLTAQGIDTSEMPAAYDSNWARQRMFHALSIKDQLAALEPKNDNGRETLAEYEAKKRIDASYRAPSSGGESLDTYEAKKKIDAKYRAPTATNGANDPTLPREVKDYLFSMQAKVVTDANNRAVLDPSTGQPVRYRLKDALVDLAATMPMLKRDHPDLDALKAQKAVTDLFQKPASTDTAAQVRDMTIPPTTMQTSMSKTGNTVRLPDGRIATFPTAAAAAEAKRRLGVK